MSTETNTPMPETEGFAAALARDLAPVRRLPRLRVVGAGVVLWALSIAAVVVLYLGPRAEVQQLRMSWPFLGIVCGLVIFAFGGLLTALGASVPGRQAVARMGTGAIAVSLLVLLAACAGMLLQGAPVGPVGESWLGGSLSCLGIATGAGILPAVAVLSFVVGAFPYRPVLAAGVGAAAMVAFGSGAVHLTCASDEFLHVSLSHVVVPLSAGALLGVGLLLLQRRRLSHRD
jgi:hypothetical protein